MNFGLIGTLGTILVMSCSSASPTSSTKGPAAGWQDAGLVLSAADVTAGGIARSLRGRCLHCVVSSPISRCRHFRISHGEDFVSPQVGFLPPFPCDHFLGTHPFGGPAAFKPFSPSS
jgi:hypothetical protein